MKQFAVIVFGLFGAFSSSIALAQQNTSSVRNQFRTTTPARISDFSLIPAISVGSGSMNIDSTANTSYSTAGATSYEVGGLVEVGHGQFVFQSGLLYMSEGMAIQETENMSDGSRIRLDGRGSLNYLGVPVAAKVRFRVADGIRLAGRAGVIPALCVSGHLAGTATAVSQSGQDLASQNFDANSLIGERVLNVFAVVGFGPEFRVTRNQTFRAEATYEQMLLSAAQDSASSMRLRSINVMLSYGFAI